MNGKLPAGKKAAMLYRIQLLYCSTTLTVNIYGGVGFVTGVAAGAPPPPSPPTSSISSNQPHGSPSLIWLFHAGGGGGGGGK